MSLIAYILGAGAIIYLLYKWATAKYKFFEERGLHCEKPTPLFGNTKHVLLNKESLGKVLMDYYQRNKQHKIVGFFNFREPMVVINDPEAIKKITIKDFEYFPNHQVAFFTENDKVLDGMLSIMKDQRWKDMRNTLSPVFTAAKMRAMYPLMNACFEECLKYLNGTIHSQGNDVEMKEFCTRLSNDVIATTAFGLKINSYVDRNNEFYTIGKTITNFRGKQLLKFLFASISPRLMDKLGVQVIDRKKTSYFMHLVVDAMKYRQEHNIVRPDMIQLLMEAKKESTHNWSDEDIVAQCLIFFFAAFENNANLICFVSHELMENPDIQERLYEEVLETEKALKGQPLNYDAVNNMKYLDMIVSETLRKWSLAAMTDRLCSKDYKLTDDDDNLLFEFKKGDKILIPIIGLHRDAQYFKNPDQFDPERFTETEKSDIKPGTYIPFGIGPRICIGNRYALMQAKAMLYYLVLNFKLKRSTKTVPDLMADMRGFQMTPVHGFWMRIELRN